MALTEVGYAEGSEDGYSEGCVVLTCAWARCTKAAAANKNTHVLFVNLIVCEALRRNL